MLADPGSGVLLIAKPFTWSGTTVLQTAFLYDRLQSHRLLSPEHCDGSGLSGQGKRACSCWCRTCVCRTCHAAQSKQIAGLSMPIQPLQNKPIMTAC